MKMAEITLRGQKTFFLYMGFLAVVIAAKYVLISQYGFQTPFWDQWDAEAANLYGPWLRGDLSWREFFSAHNEHRILVTRVLALTLFEWNGRVWDPILQMHVNAWLHVLAALLLLHLLTRASSTGVIVAVFAFSAIVFSIPFGWENTLAGFQSQFYFLLLFSFFFIYAASTYTTSSLKWWLAFAVGCLSALTLASGALTLLAGAVTLIFRRFVIGDQNDASLVAIFLCFTVTAVTILMTPSIEGHEPLKAHSVSQFAQALMLATSWPENQIKWSFVIIQAPVVLFGVRVLVSKGLRDPYSVYLVALSVWVFLQFASIAYGRGQNVLNSRYMDIFAIGLLLNFFVIVSQCSKASALQKMPYYFFGLIWISTVTMGFASSFNQIQNELTHKFDTGVAQETNVRNYLCTKNPAFLYNKPRLHIPYPDADRLKSLIDDPVIKSTLPGNIYEPNSDRLKPEDEEPFCNTGLYVSPFSSAPFSTANTTHNIASVSAISNSDWRDLGSSNPQFFIIGSFTPKGTGTGLAEINLARGDSIAYRSGQKNSGQALLINRGADRIFATELPLAPNWVLLEFSNPLLPNTFTATFIDSGTKWGEWSAIALRADINQR